MSDWFATLAAEHQLPVQAVSELEECGFVVLPGMVSENRFKQLIAAYNEVVSSATGDESAPCLRAPPTGNA